MDFSFKSTSTTSEIQIVELFSEVLPEGVNVQTVNGFFDFAALREVALKDGLSGNCITSDSKQPVKIEIHRDIQKEHIDLCYRYEGELIKIDGRLHFIKIYSPANTSFTFRLMYLPDVNE